MTRIVDWATSHARMVLACLLLSLGAGIFSYTGLPKEGAPDIEIPFLFVSVPFAGISAQDSEKLLVRPLETQLQDVDGLKDLTATASEGYAGVALSFEFGWDKAKTLADVRDKVNRAEAEFPEGAGRASINEISFSNLPVLVVAISGELPERTLIKAATELQEKIEALPSVLEAGISGTRDELLEVVIDPLKLEAYNVTTSELINVVVRNNQLIAAGNIENASGSFAVKIPSSFDDAQDVFGLPVKINGDRIVTLGEIAEIRQTFEDRDGYARHNAASTLALQVIKRKGSNVIELSNDIKILVKEVRETWPDEMQTAVSVEYSQDVAYWVEAMVRQLEGSVLTAVALVMIVVLAALGIRSALLVGFAIPSSFLLCFTFLAIMEIPISNIVMFGLILSVGMLVDGAIVVVELADRRISEGSRPMAAYAEASKRMFWPIISSTATTLCAFLPMLFWPGVAGQFMGTLPVTLIFVLSASLVVALVFLPVVGGVSGRLSRFMTGMSHSLRILWWPFRVVLAVALLGLLYLSALLALNPDVFLPLQQIPAGAPVTSLPGVILFTLASLMVSVVFGSLSPANRLRSPKLFRKRTAFGHVIQFVAGNPIMPVVVIVAIIFSVATIFQVFRANNLGVAFFVDTEPERAVVHVRARGNLSLEEKDKLVREVESLVVGTEGISSVFAFSGEGGLSIGFGGNNPIDSIGQIQIEFQLWEDRQVLGGDVTDARNIIADLEQRFKRLPGIYAELTPEASGPQQGKPVNLRVSGDHWPSLMEAVATIKKKFDETKGLTLIEDTRPLPGIDWQIDVDVEKAGRYGADVATVGLMVQLITRGILLDTMLTKSSDEEIEIRVRLPEGERLLSTLDTLRVRTPKGLTPLSNFVTRRPVAKLAVINRENQSRTVDIRSDVESGLQNEQGRPINGPERIAALTKWLDSDADLPTGIEWKWVGDQENQQESQAFLINAFIGALGLMFAVLLAQFNSVYNAILVLIAVVLSTAGVLVGMLVMQQPFSIIMTGTGIVALAGIVVNNNIVLIDTYQEYARYMPKLEAIVRTAEVRLRPVMLTTITTIAGLTPMMFGFSIDIINGGYTVDTPTALWWKSLATAVVFGLATATALTLVLTPSLLALPIWIRKGSYGITRVLAAAATGKRSRTSKDLSLARALRRAKDPTIVWDHTSIIEHRNPQTTD